MDRITVEMGPSSQVNLRVASLKTTLATKLPSRVLLPAIAKCYGEIANASKVRCTLVLPTHLLLYCCTYICSQYIAPGNNGVQKVRGITLHLKGSVISPAKGCFLYSTNLCSIMAFLGKEEEEQGNGSQISQYPGPEVFHKKRCY